MRGAVLSPGSTPYSFADLCQEPAQRDISHVRRYRRTDVDSRRGHCLAIDIDVGLGQFPQLLDRLVEGHFIPVDLRQDLIQVNVRFNLIARAGRETMSLRQTARGMRL